MLDVIVTALKRVLSKDKEREEQSRHYAVVLMRDARSGCPVSLSFFIFCLDQ